MWISSGTAITLAGVALVLVAVAVAAPLIPRPNLPPLPKEHASKPVEKAKPIAVAQAPKFGLASAALEAPERVRCQGMERTSSAPEGAAQWGGRVGTGPAAVPSDESVARLRTLLKDARTVADPRAERAEPTWVMRFVRDDHRVDVMVDPGHDRLVVVRDGVLVGGYGVTGLHREFADLDEALGRERR